ncbi:MAG: hypothetical protein R3178_08735, partial [Rhodothermales bacterium]|nr:hypothetical protein [Rhodothermales bacterium]
MPRTRYLVLLCTIFALTSCADVERTPESAAVDEGPSISGEEISYTSDGVTMNGYLAYDAASQGTRPGILVVHEWWG